MASDRQPTDAEETEETVETEQQEEAESGEVETEETAEAETEEETEAEAEGETEDEVEEEPRPSRGNRQFGALRAENRELRERLDRLERGGSQRPDPNAEAERQRREQQEEENILLSGDVGKIAKFYSDRSARQAQAQITQVVSHVVDRGDKQDFRALCAENPAVAAIAADVEKQLVISRSQGLNPTREALAKYMLGERLLSRAKGAKTRQEKRAGVERQRQQARPGTSRSDVTSSGRRTRDTHADRGKRLDDSGLL